MGVTPIYGNTHVGHPWPGVLLTGADRLDPLSFLAIVSPMCGFCLAGRPFFEIFRSNNFYQNPWGSLCPQTAPLDLIVFE